MPNKYGPNVIRRGSYPRPLSDGQVRGMRPMDAIGGRRNPQATRTLTFTMILARRAARRIRSTKHKRG
jgi:hypothetical protein